VGTIYQSIEILSKEKGIDPRIIVDAVKDAMLAAARKQFRANEELTRDSDLFGEEYRRGGHRPGQGDDPR